MAPFIDTSPLQLLENDDNDNNTAAVTHQKPKQVRFSLEIAKTPTSMILQVEEMSNRAVKGGLCKYLVKTAPLKSNVKCIVVSTKWLQASQAATKVVLTLYDSHGQVKKRLDLFGTTCATGSHPHRFITAKEQIISNQAHGDHYQLECKVTPGQDDNITIKGLLCKIISSKTIGTPYQLLDPGSRKGIFVGRVDDQGNMDGKGSFHYLENGHTFVGHFKHGKWIQGVLYYGDNVKLTMKESKFDESTDAFMMKRFQHKFQCFSKFSPKKTSIEDLDFGIEETPSLAFCGCMV